MTFNPADLVEVQRDVKALIHIPFNALGILGDTDHADGGTSYHLGRNQLRDDAYSLTQSNRDKHASNAASAFDLGNEWRFEAANDTAAKKRAQKAFLRFNHLYVAALKAKVPGTEDIREIIYTPDGDEVKTFDVLKIRSGGDLNHRTHTHTSFFRDSEGRRDGAYRKLMLRLLRQAISEEGDFMATVRQQDWDALVWRVEGLAAGRPAVAGGPTKKTPIGTTTRLEALAHKLEAVSKAVAAVAPDVEKRLQDEFKRIDADQDATLAGIKEVAADVSLDARLRTLLDRHASGELDADTVVSQLHDLLTAPTA
ncbi:hypothetical protein Ais01nite_75010 [Asanoa ishikariensis]|uniref:Uncharacterized protein n=1 Tax=Asanoa ishikariensis TaxID=137265 RepID=A0A1H3L6S1_9ACTN|nr:hypothetical protein [Asanoa ishikariensis]GIF69466.1 hypothetical protein Ais01nite_75010 [Asanoa ishikariensis]SDY59986.1 hypothetical protein SAMN05421684_0568 [Asanoa ishikariensis]